MKIATISDVHIKDQTDFATSKFFEFLDHPKVKNSDIIFLLGDIFDLMVGPFDEYIYQFEIIFKKFNQLIKEGVKIYYIAGNHDFFLEDLFLRWKNLNNINNDQFIYLEKEVVIKNNNKKIYFCHGDNIELGNDNYMLYKNFINSFFMRSVIRYIFKYNLVLTIGKLASRKSRKRSQIDTRDKVKQKFRNSAKAVFNKYDVDTLVCGHSHCIDNYITGEKNYLNGGYFINDLSFIYISDDNQVEIIKL